MTALAAARVAPPVDSDVGEAPDALTLLLLPPSGGEKAATERALPGVAAGGRRVIPPAPLPGGRTQDRGARFSPPPFRGRRRRGSPSCPIIENIPERARLHPAGNRARLAGPGAKG